MNLTELKELYNKVNADINEYGISRGNYCIGKVHKGTGMEVV